VVSQVAKLGWANKGEVGWVEYNSRPFAFQCRLSHINKFTIVISSGLERFDFCID
jgi:hypothetical protein